MRPYHAGMDIGWAPIKLDTAATDDVLNAIAHIPTRSLPSVVDKAFFEKLSDRDFMRIAYFLAKKSFDEGGCPIGAVIVDNGTHQIIGKGHNTLVQESDPYNHGETSAIRMPGGRTSAGQRSTPHSAPAMCAPRFFICASSPGSS